MSSANSTRHTLPDGWNILPLEDVADILDGKRVPVNAKERETRTGKVPYYGATGQVGWIDDYLFDEELVLLGEDGAPFLDASKPKAYVIRGKSWVNNYAHVLRAKDGIPNAYLKYFLDRFDYHGFVTGTTRLKLTQGAMRQIPISLPPPEDRKHIVTEIEKQFSRLDEAVALLKRTKANLKRYKAAVLKAAVEGKLTEDWRKQHSDVEPAGALLERILVERRAKWSDRGKYKEPAAADVNGLPSLPKCWTWARLEQLGATFGGLTKNPQRAKFTRKLPYLRVANVYANELRLDEIEHIGVKDSELDKLLLRKGDLLVVEGNGSKDQIGRLAIWDGSIDDCVHQNHLIKVRLVVGLMNKWILFWLLSPVGRHFIEEVSSSTSGLYTLSVNKVADLPIIVLPLAEQEQIVAEVERRLSIIDELETTVEANLTRADRLRQSILSQAFAGKLTCVNANREGRQTADIEKAKA